MPWIGFVDNHSPPSAVARTAAGVSAPVATRAAAPAPP
jgi:hypothetical protein